MGMHESEQRPDEERLLDAPAGGPEARSAEGKQDDTVDPSAGAAGQDDRGDAPEGAVEDAVEETGDPNPTPG